MVYKFKMRQVLRHNCYTRFILNLYTEREQNQITIKENFAVGRIGCQGGEQHLEVPVPTAPPPVSIGGRVVVHMGGQVNTGNVGGLGAVVSG